MPGESQRFLNSEGGAPGPPPLVTWVPRRSPYARYSPTPEPGRCVIQTALVRTHLPPKAGLEGLAECTPRRRVQVACCSWIFFQSDQTVFRNEPQFVRRTRHLIHIRFR